MTGAACSLTVSRRGLIAVRALQRVAVAIKAHRLRRRKLPVRITSPLICCVLDERCRSLARRKASILIELNDVLAACKTLASNPGGENSLAYATGLRGHSTHPRRVKITRSKVM